MFPNISLNKREVKMSGITMTNVHEEGEETVFRCLSIGHFFHSYLIEYNDGVVFRKSSSCVKTGNKTAFDLDCQKGFRFGLDEPVLRIHSFTATQTIED